MEDNDLGYIKKADAIIAMINMLHPYLEMEDAAFKVFDAIPTVDYVPIVRCKDCRYWINNNGGDLLEDCRFWGDDKTPDESDFCSYGERK